MTINKSLWLLVERELTNNCINGVCRAIETLRIKGTISKLEFDELQNIMFDIEDACNVNTMWWWTHDETGFNNRKTFCRMMAAGEIEAAKEHVRKTKKISSSQS